MTDLNELSRLLEQATPGPWQSVGSFLYGVSKHGDDVILFSAKYRDAEIEDLRLTAALRNHAEALIRDARACAEIRRVIAAGKDDGSVGRVARRAIAECDK